MSELKSCWLIVLKIVNSEIEEVQFTTWILPLIPKRIDEEQNVLYVGAENQLIIDRLNDRYLKLIEHAVYSAFGKPYKVIAELVEKKERQEAG